MAGRLQRLMSLLVLGAGCVLAAAAHAADLRITQDNSTVSIFDGDRLVLHYRYAGVSKKPYVDQIFTPSGVQVLRDSPHDHVHHHALMFAIGVDQVDFWTETGNGYQNHGLGRQLHRSWGVVKADVGKWAGFTERLDWVGPESENLLLLERREIAVLKKANLGATLIDWTTKLETPPDKPSVTLSGSHYFGLGMRFVESMDKGGRFFNADDKPGEVVRGDERLTAVKWCAYTAKADGKPVTAAIFDHPGNVRHPAKMFTMSKPFAYLSATLNVWKEPLVVKAGKPLELRYGVALWDGEVDKATVEKLYQRWLKLSGAE